MSEQENKRIRFITIVKYRAYDRDHSAVFVDNEIPMRYTRRRRLRLIAPAAQELSFVIFEGRELDRGESPIPEVKTERIKADDAMRARAEGIISQLRAEKAEKEKE